MDLDRPLVLATRNRGKVAEFRRLTEAYGVELRCLDDFGPIPQVEEDGETFEDNACKKAAFAARILGMPAIADDSGLSVDALGGLPGVMSARYAGEGATDEANNRKLLHALERVEDRKAAFVCVVAVAVPRGPALLYEGRCKGVITRECIGDRGFGYDPVFYYPPMEKTFAQMTVEEKNRVSHRGSAMAELGREFDKVVAWLRLRLREEP